MKTDTSDRVIDCVAAATRYPRELLKENADLESDLGIDSVKRVEIVAGLAEEFRLDLDAEQRDPSIRTIHDISQWINRLTVANEVVSNKVGEPKRPSSANSVSRASVQPASVQTAATAQTAEEAATAQTHFISERHEPFVTPPSLGGNGRVDEPCPPNRRSLDGRVAFVTGSGRSVGRTIARVLASRGAAVAVNSFHSREEGEATVAAINSSGGTAFHVWGSVANPEHVSNMFAQIESRFHGLDILVCNASDGRIGSFSDLTADDWDRAFRTNVSGHHQCAMQAAQLMQPRGGGAIVTMSAVGAHRFIDGLGSQGVVKAAVETMTKYLACELAPYGIRSNCVSGGPVYGELLSRFPESQSAQQHWESMTPGGELSSPVDLAQTIAFLVSDEARGINGAVWQVDQGFSAIADGRPLRSRSLRGAHLSSF